MTKTILLPVLLLSITLSTYAQSKEELTVMMLTEVGKVLDIAGIQISETELTTSDLTKTLSGKCNFFNTINTDYKASFDAGNKIGSFSITIPAGQKMDPSKLNTIMRTGDWTSFFLPDDVKASMFLSKYSISFTKTPSVSDISTEFSISTPMPVFGISDIKLNNIKIGYKISDPLTKPALTGLLGATVAWGSTTFSMETNLVKDPKEWELSFALNNLTFNDVITKFGIPNDLTIPVPVNNLLKIDAAKITIKPAVYSFVFDGSSPLGKVNFVVKRVTTEGKPVATDTLALNTSLTGAYTSVNTLPAGSAGGGSSAPSSPAPATHKWGIMMGYQLPESNDAVPAIKIMRQAGLTNIGMVVSTFDDNIETSLPIFSNLGTGNTSVSKGFTFIAWIPVDDLLNKYKLTQPLRAFAPEFMAAVSQANVVENVMFRANVPVDMANFSLEAALNFNDNMKLIPTTDIIILRQLKLKVMPASTNPEFSFGAGWEMKIDPTRDKNKPLLFDVNMLVKPTLSTVTLAIGGSMLSSWDNPYGMTGLGINSVRIQAGVTFQCDAYCIPVPDDLFFTGQLMYGKIMGDVTMALNYNELTKNMVVARTCNLSMKNVLDQWLQGLVKTEFDKKKSTYLKMLDDAINMEIKDAYIKAVPPQAPTGLMSGLRLENDYTKNCPSLLQLDNTWTPGIRMAAAGDFAGWKGMFDIGAEGTLSSLQGGVTVKAKMDPIKLNVPVSGYKVFHLTGASGNDPFELYFDLSTKSLIDGVKGLLSDPNASKTPVATVNTGAPLFIQAKHSNKVIDIPGAAINYGVTAQQHTLNRTGAQQFIFEALGDGYYFIQNVNSKMNLDVQNGIGNAGQAVWQYVPNTTPAQLFKLVPKGDGYYEFESKLNSNLVFEISGNNNADGAQLKMANRNGAPNQQFKLLPVETTHEPITSNSDRIFYLSGMVTILEAAANARTLIELTPHGYKLQVNGKIYKFLDGSIDATIGSFRNILTTTTVKAEVNTGAIYQQIAGELQKIVGDIPFFNELKKGFVLERIYFGGQLSGLQSGADATVKYKIAGQSFNTTVRIQMNGNVADLARTIAGKIKETSIHAIALTKKTFDDVVKNVSGFAAGIAGQVSSTASSALKDAKDAAKKAEDEMKDLKKKLTDGGKTVYNDMKGGLTSATQKTAQFFSEFGSFSKNTVEKIYNKSFNTIKNGWNDFTNDVKKLFTGGDNHELLMYNGPGYRIITKFPNQVVKATATTQKDFPAITGIRQNRPEEIWQLVPNDTEGSFFMVSGFNGMLMANALRTSKKLNSIIIIPHERDHKDRERLLLEPVANEPGWFYIKYHKDNYYIIIQDGRLALSQYRVNNDNGKFRFEKAVNIDWKASKTRPPVMTTAVFTENTRYSMAGQPEQYLYAGGEFRWIPDMETLTALQLDTRPLITFAYDQIAGFMIGKPIPSRKDGSLVQAINEPAKYIIENGNRRWIPDMETFIELGLLEEMVQYIPKQELLAIPEGKQIPSRFIPKFVLYEKLLYQVPGDPTVYFVMNNTRRGVPDPETLFAMGYNWEMVQKITAQDMNSLPKGPNLPSRKDGSLVQAVNKPEVFVIEKGIRRHITDAETFNALKFDWNKIQQVSIADLNDIPAGPALMSIK
jgi:hypothetical protein